MRLLLAAAGFAVLLATPAFASTGDAMKTCAAAWQAMSPADKAKTTYKAYSAACLKKPAPATASMTPAMAPAMAPVTPQDRMKACAAKWADMKKAGTTGGMTYAKFNATCLKK